jgi:acyl-CoA thioester hydrolase
MEEHSAPGAGPGRAAGPGGPETSLEAYPVTVQLPVQWSDMDAYGHVNNTAFFRYFESARVEYLVRCGFQASYERSGIGAILHSADCRFRRALVYPDRVISATRATEVGEDRFTLEYRLVSLDQEALAAKGSSVVVSFDYGASSKAPIPESVRRGIEMLEAQVGRHPEGL